jgi:hypothetical protein
MPSCRNTVQGTPLSIVLDQRNHLSKYLMFIGTDLTIVKAADGTSYLSCGAINMAGTRIATIKTAFACRIGSEIRVYSRFSLKFTVI